MQKIKQQIIDKLREIDYAVLDLHHQIAVALCEVAELDTRGLTLHDAETPIQLSNWLCKKCSHTNNGLDEICQFCKTPKAS
jgi:hypothetical protein